MQVSRTWAVIGIYFLKGSSLQLAEGCGASHTYPGSTWALAFPSWQFLMFSNYVLLAAGRGYHPFPGLKGVVAPLIVACIAVFPKFGFFLTTAPAVTLQTDASPARQSTACRLLHSRHRLPVQYNAGFSGVRCLQLPRCAVQRDALCSQARRFCDPFWLQIMDATCLCQLYLNYKHQHMFRDRSCGALLYSILGRLGMGARGLQWQGFIFTGGVIPNLACSTAVPAAAQSSLIWASWLGRASGWLVLCCFVLCVLVG